MARARVKGVFFSQTPVGLNTRLAGCRVPGAILYYAILHYTVYATLYCSTPYNIIPYYITLDRTNPDRLLGAELAQRRAHAAYTILYYTTLCHAIL